MSTFPSTNRASYMFFVGSHDDKSVQRRVKDEMLKFGDVVQIDTRDIISNLAVKSVSAAAWAVTQLDSIRYLLKVEDFMASDLKKIDKLVEELLSESKPHALYYAGGVIFGGTGVVRDGRWGCPKKHCPYDTYPFRYAGGQYMLSRSALQALASKGLSAFDLQDPYPIEDHYVASMLAKQSISVKEERRLSWQAGKPYGAPSVVQGNFLLCLDTEDRPEVEEGEEGVWEGGSLALPAGTRVARAWYGDPEARWSADRGKDVTDSVLDLLKRSSTVKAGNQFGDPAPGARKVLLVKVNK